MPIKFSSQIKDPLVLEALRSIELEFSSLQSTLVDNIDPINLLDKSAQENIEGDYRFKSIRVEDSDRSDYAIITHDGVWGHYGGINREGKGITIGGTGAGSTVGQLEMPNNLLLADDATGTLALRRATGILIVTVNFDKSMVAILAHSGSNLDTIYAGSNMSIGATGTNPDVDTNFNIWKSSSLVLSIKNRIGSSRTFGSWNFTG